MDNSVLMEVEDFGAQPETPEFGVLPPAPFEPLPERIVLTSEEHLHLASPSMLLLEGDFTGSIGSGYLAVEHAAAGDVHLRADVQRQGLPAIQLDATVRESWVARAAGDRATVVAELLRLAELPRQSTVSVRTPAAC